MKHTVILASGSKTRADLLRSAGVSFDVIPAKVDEAAIKASLLSEGAKPNDIVDALAEYKALRIVGKHPSGLVIGCDQVLVCENQIYDKATTLAEAREKLLSLRGKPHQLLSAAVIFEDGKPVWRTVGRAQLFMREFSDEFLDGYLARGGEDLLQSVGCYFLESEGVQLFSRIQGDYFTVLGFPLLEVVAFLRTRGVIET
ncbi:Maf-like protein [Amylibacter ulvae]|uniref:Nucleoside triphosphate pyrophosphatase n=1 Tax=Paramylibacter ulvae TaxID=1651968 RepID=A0ABQ3CYN8_9RHOB|nr:Maf family protein [Amylibacter ulvae]GHA48254.1 Maf-like protein [Amylibacter ulvae]